MVRLVKGAYWDTEVKRAQERGLADYPVFTRKAMTDLCYLDCAAQIAGGAAATLSAIRDPQCADRGLRDRRRRRNSTVTNFSGCTAWASALYEALLDDLPDLTCRVYAPVGGYSDLLAYLVRRLLENGANSSFVSVAADSCDPCRIHFAPAAELDRRRDRTCATFAYPLPRDLFGLVRRNSVGVEFGDRASLEALLAEVRAAPQGSHASALIDGVAVAGRERPVNSPIDGNAPWVPCRKAMRLSSRAALSAAEADFSARGAQRRLRTERHALERAGDLIEKIAAG